MKFSGAPVWRDSGAHEAFLLKPLGEQLCGLPVVLDQQYSHRGLSYRPWDPPAQPE